MGFESVMEKEMAGREFGRDRYFPNGKERPHLSRSKLLAHGGAEFVKVGERKQVAHGGGDGKVYAVAEGLTYDLLVTFYDATSQQVSMMRLFGDDLPERALRAGLEAVRSASPDIEARVIGLQNGGDHASLGRILRFLREQGVTLAEADLFGGNVRHIAIDLRTGASYNILARDRSYGPGELLNRRTLEDFQRSLILAPKV
jgi:hypothetical protein